MTAYGVHKIKYKIHKNCRKSLVDRFNKILYCSYYNFKICYFKLYFNLVVIRNQSAIDPL